MRPAQGPGLPAPAAIPAAPVRPALGAPKQQPGPPCHAPAASASAWGPRRGGARAQRRAPAPPPYGAPHSRPAPAYRRSSPILHTQLQPLPASHPQIAIASRQPAPAPHHTPSRHACTPRLATINSFPLELAPITLQLSGFPTRTCIPRPTHGSALLLGMWSLGLLPAGLPRASCLSPLKARGRQGRRARASEGRTGSGPAGPGVPLARTCVGRAISSRRPSQGRAPALGALLSGVGVGVRAWELGRLAVPPSPSFAAGGRDSRQPALGWGH